MKQRKYFTVCTAIACASMLLFSGCGNKPSTKEFNDDQLAEEILREVSFATPLSEVDDEDAAFMFMLPEDLSVDIDLYMATGTYADEFVIFDTDSADDAEKVKAIAETHISEIKASFSDYLPEEVPKIDNAILITHGEYVILCITDDHEKAASIIQSHIE